MRGDLSVLPKKIIEKIVNKSETTFKLKDWIPIEKLYGSYLSLNPNAIELLKANPEKINWENLSRNPNPEAIELCKLKPNKLNWKWLSENPNAIELLKEYRKKLYWKNISKNPAIFDEVLV